MSLVEAVAAVVLPATQLQALDAAGRALTGPTAVEMAPALADLVRRGEAAASFRVGATINMQLFLAFMVTIGTHSISPVHPASTAALLTARS
jgi:hypothetical protein